MLTVLAHHQTYDLEKGRKITKDIYKCTHKINSCMLHAINLSKNSIISPSVYSFMRWNARCARLEMHEAYKLLQKGILYYGLKFPQIFERTKNSFEEQTLRTIDILWNTDIQPYQEKNYDLTERLKPLKKQNILLSMKMKHIRNSTGMEENFTHAGHIIHRKE